MFWLWYLLDVVILGGVVYLLCWCFFLVYMYGLLLYCIIINVNVDFFGFFVGFFNEYFLVFYFYVGFWLMMGLG